MNTNQRGVIAVAAGLLAVIFFAVFFLPAFWDWATWNEKKGTLDLGFVKFTTRPAFPSDGRSLGLGLVLPIALVAAARVLVLSGRGKPGDGA